MALAIYIYNASFMLQLDADPYGVRYGSGLGTPDAERIHAHPWGRGFAPLVGVNYGNRVQPWLLKLTGTSLDNWIVNSRQLHQLLTDAEIYWQSGGTRGDRAYISIQLDGATNAIEYDIISGVLEDGGIAAGAGMTVTTGPFMLDVPLTLTVRPFGHPQAIVGAISGTLDNGDAAYTITPVGDREAPLRLTFVGAADFERVIVARRTRGDVSNYKALMEGEPGTYPGYSVEAIDNSARFSITSAAGTGPHGSSYAKIEQVSGQSGSTADIPLLRWRIESDLSDMYGRHHAFVVFHTDGTSAQNSTEMTALALTYGGTISSAAGNGDIVLPSVSPPWGGASDLGTPKYMGVIEIPHRAGNLDDPLSSFDVSIRGTFTSVTGKWGVDCLLLFPADEQYMDVTLNTTAASGDFLVNDNVGIPPSLYLTDSGGTRQPEYPIGQTQDTRFSLIPNIPNKFIAFTFTASGTAVFADDLVLAFEYFPQYDLFR